jgi:hypothetical protein
MPNRVGTFISTGFVEYVSEAIRGWPAFQGRRIYIPVRRVFVVKSLSRFECGLEGTL